MKYIISWYDGNCNQISVVEAKTMLVAVEEFDKDFINSIVAIDSDASYLAWAHDGNKLIEVKNV